MKFCDYFKQKRVALGTVRKFAKDNDYDPAYISRLENGITMPPKEKLKLKKLGESIGLQEGTKDWSEFLDLAAVAKSEIPEDLKNDARISTVLPAFYRTLRNETLDKNEAEMLLKLIKESGRE